VPAAPPPPLTRSSSGWRGASGSRRTQSSGSPNVEARALSMKGMQLSFLGAQTSLQLTSPPPPPPFYL
jgi:hypothetical protein